jgi:ribosome assembly protein 1
VKRLYSERIAQEQERTTSGADDASDPAADGEAISQQEIEAEDTSAEAGQVLTVEELKAGLEKAFEEEKHEKEIWKDVVEKITAFGPRRVGPNLLIDATEDGICHKL